MIEMREHPGLALEELDQLGEVVGVEGVRPPVSPHDLADRQLLHDTLGGRFRIHGQIRGGTTAPAERGDELVTISQHTSIHFDFLPKLVGK